VCGRVALADDLNPEPITIRRLLRRHDRSLP